MTKYYFSCSIEKACDLVGLINTNVCGPFQVSTRYGERYYITFTNDFIRYSYVFSM